MLPHPSDQQRNPIAKALAEAARMADQPQEEMVACYANFPHCGPYMFTIVDIPASKCACHVARKAYEPFVKAALRAQRKAHADDRGV